MAVILKPLGTLNIGTDPTKLSQFDFVRCKNLRLDQSGVIKTRDGSSLVNDTALTAINTIVEQVGDRIIFEEAGSTDAPIYVNEEKINKSWVAYFDNSRWSADTGSWDAGNSEWDSDDIGFGHEISLIAAGTWASGFRPTKIRITHDSVGALNFSLSDTAGSYSIAESSGYDCTSGKEYDCTFGSNNLKYLTRIYNEAGTAFSITNIEFYV